MSTSPIITVEVLLCYKTVLSITTNITKLSSHENNSLCNTWCNQPTVPQLLHPSKQNQLVIISVAFQLLVKEVLHIQLKPSEKRFSNEEECREEQSLPTFDLFSVVHEQQCLFTLLHFCPDDDLIIHAKQWQKLFRIQVGIREPSFPPCNNYCYFMMFVTSVINSS